MKKLILSAALVSVIGFANAQELMSKKGFPILPEEKDWSIGFDAMPVLHYFGNVLNGNTNNSAAIDYQTPFTIVGKYMRDANTAYRAKVRIGFSSSSQDAFIHDETQPITTTADVTDTRKTTAMNITIGGGIQKYRGKGRLKGFYGAEAGVMIGSDKTTYSYGNAIDATYTDASANSTDFGANIVGTGSGSRRVTEDKSGSTFGVMLRGFIGAEYFFAPKMSVGVEYGWGLNLSSTGEGNVTTEGFDATANATTSVSAKTAGNSDFSIDVDNAGAAIYLSLYF